MYLIEASSCQESHGNIKKTYKQISEAYVDSIKKNFGRDFI